jgi:acyl-coenzyme A thioesterase PaaI-like protein
MTIVSATPPRAATAAVREPAADKLARLAPDTVVAVGTVVHHGRRTATAEARLVAEETGQLLATATSTLLVMGPGA